MKIAQYMIISGLITGLTAVSSARANQIEVFNTGVDSSNILLPAGSVDPYYSLISSPLGSGSAFVVDSGSPISPAGPWVANDSVSQWIAPAANLSPPISDPLGQYTYQITFNLAGLNPSTAEIQGLWTSDNNATISINEISTSNTIGAYTYGSLTPFSITSGFVYGINTLDFVVTQISCGGCDDNPTGLRVEFTSATASPSIPEPSTWAMMLAGFGGLALAGYRARRASLRQA